MSYSIEEWATAEAAGLVCLPVSGYRDGSRVIDVGNYGYSWSSSASNENENFAYSVFFMSGSVTPGYYVNRYCGFSVRLITEVK